MTKGLSDLEKEGESAGTPGAKLRASRAGRKLLDSPSVVVASIAAVASDGKAAESADEGRNGEEQTGRVGSLRSSNKGRLSSPLLAKRRSVSTKLNKAEEITTATSRDGKSLFSRYLVSLCLIVYES